MSGFFERREGNHNILVGTPNEFESGLIRIEPPVEFSDSTLASASNKWGVVIRAVAADSEASLYSYYLDTVSYPHGKTQAISGKEKVDSTLDDLAVSLRYLGSSEVLRETY